MRIKIFAALVLAVALAACSGGGGGGGSTIVAPPNNPPPPLGYTPPIISPADWPTSRRDQQRTGNNAMQTTITKANVATLKLKWRATAFGGMRAEPAVVTGVVYAATLGGSITALDEKTGQTIWTFIDAAANSFKGTPAVVNGVLYDGTLGLPGRPSAFYALNAATGRVIWKSQSTDPNATFSGSPLAALGEVFEGHAVANESFGAHGTCDPAYQLVSFDQRTGAQVDYLTLTPLGATGADIWSAPMLDSTGSLYVATGNDCQYVTPLQYAAAVLKVQRHPMRVQWTMQVIKGLTDDDFGATPLFINGSVVAANKNGTVYALDPSTGVVKWQTSLASGNDAIIGSLASDGQHIVVPIRYVSPNCTTPGQLCGAIVGLNLNGTVAWKVPVPNDEFGVGALSPPAISQGMAFVAYTDGISALDINTGAVLWHYQAQHAIYAGPTIVDGGLFIGEWAGSNFYAFTPNGQ